LNASDEDEHGDDDSHPTQVPSVQRASRRWRKPGLAGDASNVKDSIDGVWHHLLTGRSMRWFIGCFTIILAGSFVRGMSPSHIAIVALSGGFVCAIEGCNTAIEQLCNVVQPDYDERIKQVKHAAAGAVLIAATFCGLIMIYMFIYPR
jgi:diacylglycerol kinase